MTGVNIEPPGYKLEEDNDCIKMTVPAPLSRPKTAVIALEGNVLTFDSPPYLLQLKLPCKVLDDYSNISFDNQANIYTIKLKKDLNAARYKSKKNNEDTFECPEEELILSGREDESKSNSDRKKVEDQFYGFGNLYSKVFGQHYSEFFEVIDLPDPDKTTPQQRTKLRIDDENKKWNPDHYLADFMEPEDLMENYLNYKPPWVTKPVKDKLSSYEIEDLEELPKKDWLRLGLPEHVQKTCELQMVDILFGYAYNKRVAEGTDSAVFAWNITKISSTLSWFETFKDLKEVLLTCYKRTITYPLCRSWELADFVKNDVVNILKLGSKQITRCFLEVRDIFNETENFYILNNLFINDMCHFAYNLSSEKAIRMSEEVQKIEVDKCDVIEELPLLEYAAQLVANENNPEELEKMDLEKLAEKMKYLNVKSTEKPSDSDSDEGDDCTSSDGESSDDTDNSDDILPQEGADKEAPDSEGSNSDSGEEEEDEDESEGDDEEDFEGEEDEEEDEDDELEEGEEEEDVEDERWNALCEDEEKDEEPEKAVSNN